MKIFLFILVIIFAPLALSLVDIFMFSKPKGKKSLIGLIIKDVSLIELLGFSIVGGIFGYNNLFNPLKNSYGYVGLLFLAMLVVLGLYCLNKWLEAKYLNLEPRSFHKRGGTIANYVLAIFLTFIGFIALFGTAWGKRMYAGASIDQIVITIFSPTTGTDVKLLISFIDEAVVLSFGLTYLVALILYKIMAYKISLKSGKILINNKFSKITSILVSVFIFFLGGIYLFIRFDIGGLIMSYVKKSPYIEENYEDPNDVTLKFPKEKRNLIHIYLESVENSYFDKANGGNMDTNLMPNLLELTKEGYSFSHLGKGEGKGGPLTTNGATWSVASMVNQFFGVPMKAPSLKNSYGSKGHFLPGAIGIGDILAKASYNQSVMFGADADFGGLTYMFEDHGNFNILDYKYFLENHRLPTDDYRVNWGFEDEKLYEFAKEELTRLASLDKPFHFLMENADTHVPGFAFKDGKPDFNGSKKDLDYGMTVSYSDKMVTEFIRWIMDQPFYENTTIVIIGDHLSMERKFFRENDFENYHRTTFNLILNPIETLDLNKEELFYNRKWGSFDMMPTLLASIGVEVKGNRLGLGTNLFSSTPTLYERDGYEYVNDLFKRRSPFYSQVLLGEKRTYTADNLILPKKLKLKKEELI